MLSFSILLTPVGKSSQAKSITASKKVVCGAATTMAALVCRSPVAEFAGPITLSL